MVAAIGTLLVRYWYAIGTLGRILWISKDSMDSMDVMDIHGFHGYLWTHDGYPWIPCILPKIQEPHITMFPYEM